MNSNQAVRSHAETMPKDQFLRLIEEMLQMPANALTGSETLTGTEGWDSLAVLDFMALMDRHLGVLLSVDGIAACDTFNDLHGLIAN